MTGGPPDAAVLLAEWEALSAVSPGDRLFRTRRLVRPVRLDLRTGLREIDGAPCLIALPGDDANDRLATFETAGLRLSRAADAAGILLVLSLEEPARRDLFAEICSDCVRAVMREEEEGEADLMGALAGRLAAWRAFLRDQTGRLPRHEIIGLIGELMIFNILIDRSADVATWKSPDDGLHDFEDRGHALEVKTSLGAARRLHISTLDQLDEAGLAALHVAHVLLVEQADGETVGELASRIEARLESEHARREFRNALLRRGLAPGTEETTGPRVGCSAIEYYSVWGTFPRLRRGDIALGISEAAYDVEVRALAGFAADSDAALRAFGKAK